MWRFGIIKSLAQIILKPEIVWRGRNNKSLDPEISISEKLGEEKPSGVLNNGFVWGQVHL